MAKVVERKQGFAPDGGGRMVSRSILFLTVLLTALTPFQIHGQNDRVTELLDEFESDNPEDRKSALFSLSNYEEDPRAVEVFIKALADDNSEVRLYALTKFPKTSDPRAIPAIVDVQNNDGDCLVRSQAAEALAGIEDDRAIDALINAMNSDESFMVRGRAVNSLASHVRYSRHTVNEKILSALCSALLVNDEPSTRHAVAWAMHDISDPRVVEPLILALNDEDINVRKNAAEAFGRRRIKEPRAVEPLIRTLKTDIPFVTTWAAFSLGKMDDFRATGPLIDVLNEDYEVTEYISDERDEKWFTAGALGELGDPRAIEPLIHVMNNHEDVVIRWKAAESLGMFDDARAALALLDASVSEVEGLGNEAVFALIDMGEPALEPLSTALKDKKRDFEVQLWAASIIGETSKDNPELESYMKLVEKWHKQNKRKIQRYSRRHSEER
ncbi:hypothetical protein GF359_06070 [candidate division WOR-3 bacterium]|uniref:HEAT repeat domain-containing protein n=1 Tax=candidate division WOR-3 bacterium TaxID=2052148 RepID=A0A9D5KAW5_UNCW3|nr:hypothetical protein [candidate division WOR-3 bacterium]MBD3364765.1 hypothetical protein [candidate division WOR-3 bacterium]